MAVLFRVQPHAYAVTKEADFAVKPIGFQNQTHWVLKPNPLGFKIKPIGFQNQTHWVLKSNPLDLAKRSSEMGGVEGSHQTTTRPL